jgi:hypothetical protein
VTAAPRIGALAPAVEGGAGGGGGGSFAGDGSTAAASAGRMGSESAGAAIGDIGDVLPPVSGAACEVASENGDDETWRAVKARMLNPAAIPTAAKVTITANALPT